MGFSLRKFMLEKKKQIEDGLDRYLPKENEYPPLIHEAMRYAVFGGGKRVRPILTIATAEAVGGRGEDVLPTACALEFIHTYSLIHDDLPSMDNDDYRRGRLSIHKKFGEAIAILTGDALLTYAFRLLVENSKLPGISKGVVLRVIEEICTAIGTFGMIGGQVVDIEEGKKTKDATILQYVHTHKTASLITASVRVGGILCNCTNKDLKPLTQYGEHMGLAFQIMDDIQDTEKKKDKTKLTYPAVYGVAESMRRAKELIENAISALSDFDKKADPLRAIARYVIRRRY